MICYYRVMRPLRNIAIGVNALYILWMIYNGIDEGFQAASIVQLVSAIGMICLLVLNIFLLWNGRQL